MENWLEALLALQAVDIKIHNLQVRKLLIPKERARLSKELDSAMSSLKELKTAARKTENDIKEDETKIVKHYDAIAKIQQRSTMIRKNDEYQAALNEIEKNKEQISQLEGDILLLLDKQENIRKRLQELETETEARTVNVRSEMEEIQGLDQEIDELVAELKMERGPLAGKVQSDILNQYENLLRNLQNGPPLVKIVNESCMHCHLRVTPQTLNSAKKGMMTICDNCSHLVYLPME